MGGVGEHAAIDIRLVALRDLQPVGVDIVRQRLRPEIPCLADIGEGQAGLTGMDAPLAKVYILRLTLHQMGSQPLHPPGQLGRRFRHRPAGHDHAARGIGAGGIGCRGGVAQLHRDILQRDTQRLIGDLRQRGFQPLADGVDAGAHFQRAIGQQLHRRLLETRHQRQAPGGKHLGAMRRLLGIGGEADANAPAIRLAALLAFTDRGQADHLPRLGEAAGIIAGIVMLVGHVGVGHLRCLHQILGPHIGRVAAHGAGNRIDGQLDGEAHAGPRHAAIGREGRLVGRHRICPRPIGPEIIGAGQITAGLRRLQTGRERPDRIGANIDIDLRIQPQQPATLVGIGGDLVVMLAGIGPGRQMLAPVLDPAISTFMRHGEPGDRHLLRLQQAFIAEAATDIGWADADARLVEAQALRQAGADQMRHLGRGDDNQLVGLEIPVGDEALALHRMHALPGGPVFPHHLHRRGLRHLLDAAVEIGDKAEIVAPFLMHQRGVLRLALLAFGNRRQLVEIDGDQLRQVLRLGPAGGDAQRDALTDIAHLLMRQRIIGGQFVARQAGPGDDRGDRRRHIGPEEHLILPPLRLGEAADMGMRHRAAQEGNLQHAGHLDVADEAPAPHQMAGILLAPDTRADALTLNCPLNCRSRHPVIRLSVIIMQVC